MVLCSPNYVFTTRAVKWRREITTVTVEVFLEASEGKNTLKAVELEVETARKDRKHKRQKRLNEAAEY